MSSVSYNDSTCTNLADKLSCEAMSTLAKQEYFDNRIQELYLINNPACERYHSLADREQEHFLQKSLGISRNVCFDKTPAFQQGAWENQYIDMVNVPTFYEKWTRSKNNTVSCQPARKDIGKCDVKPMDQFPGPCGFALRR